MKIKNKQFDALALVSLVNSIIAIIAVALCVYGFNRSELISAPSIFISILLMISVIISSHFSWRFEQSELSYLNCLLSVYIWPRLAQYSVAPDIVIFPADSIGGQNLSIGLFWFTAFYIVTVFAFTLARRFFRAKNLALQHSSNRLKTKIIVGALVVIIGFLVEGHFLISSSNSPYQLFENQTASDSSAAKALNVFVAIDTSLVFLTYFVFVAISKSSQWKKIFGLTILLAVIHWPFFEISALFGSRGAGIKTIHVLLVMVLLFPKDWKVFSCAFSLGVACVIVSLLDFSAATQMRDFKRKMDAPFWEEITSRVASEARFKAHSKEKQTPLADILNRIGSLDYFVVTLSRSPAPGCIEDKIALRQQAKSVANWLALGTPFPEAKYGSPSKFGQCYRPHYPRQVRLNNENWTMAGTIFQFIGGFGLLIVGVYAFAVNAAQMMARKYNNLFTRISYITSFSTLSASPLFIMGLDHFVISLGTIALRIMFFCIIFYVAFWGIKHLGRMKLRKPKAAT